jgi:hypothetical protein
MSYNGKNLTFGCQNEGVSTSISKARKSYGAGMGRNEWGDFLYLLGQTQVFYGVLLGILGTLGNVPLLYVRWVKK